MSLSPSITDPIASEVGHGAPGLRDGLRQLDELVLASASQKHAFLELRPVKALTGWSSDTTAGVYVIAWTETWAGILRDVVGVKTSSATLVRAETLAACRATEGTYFFDPDVLDSGRRWDAELTWDSGVVWDDVPLLYVHLSSGGDPDNTAIVAQAGFYYGSHGVTQPTLGPEKASGSWSSTAVGAGGGTATPASTGGTVTGSINGSGGRGVAQASLAAVAGRWYRVSGTYTTDAALAAGLEARLRVGVAGTYLEATGDTGTAGTSGLTLTPTYGLSRRFTFDFVWPGADSAALEVLAFVWNTTGGALTCAGVTFSALSCKRVHRWEAYQARLDGGSLPTCEQGRGDAFFGPIARGSGTLTLLNGDGHFEAPLAGLDWFGACEVTARIGGRFVDGGNEVDLADMWTAISGVVTTQPRITDAQLTLPFEDGQKVVSTPLPPNAYDVSTYSTLASEDQGKRRPMLFGAASNVPPVRVSTSGYGTWATIDPTNAPGLLHDNGGPPAAQPNVYSYLDAEAAEREDSLRRATLPNGDDGTPGFSNVTGLFTIPACPRAFEMTAENNLFQMNLGWLADATVPVGVYLLGGRSNYIASSADSGLLNALCRAINTAAADTNTTATFDATTGKVTITRGSGTFQILAKTGTLGERGIYRLLGFTGSTDYTGALSYTSDVSIWTSMDQLNLRVASMNGYLDDAAGTYTGTPYTVIQYAPDVVRCLLVRWCGVDPAKIDSASFVAARAACTQPLAMYLSQAEEFAAILERIENSVGYELVFDAGLFYFRARDNSVPSDAVDLTERDYLALEAGYDAEDIFGVVRVGYAPVPTTGEYRMAQTESAATRLRFNRPDQRTFYTYLANQADALTRRAALATDAQTKRRRYSLAVKGSLLRRALGAKVRLTRAKGLSTTGALSSVLTRIVSKQDNPATWETSAELIEVI